MNHYILQSPIVIPNNPSLNSTSSQKEASHVTLSHKPPSITHSITLEVVHQPRPFSFTPFPRNHMPRIVPLALNFLEPPSLYSPPQKTVSSYSSFPNPQSVSPPPHPLPPTITTTTTTIIRLRSTKKLRHAKPQKYIPLTCTASHPASSFTATENTSFPPFSSNQPPAKYSLSSSPFSSSKSCARTQRLRPLTLPKIRSSWGRQVQSRVRRSRPEGRPEALWLMSMMVVDVSVSVSVVVVVVEVEVDAAAFWYWLMVRVTVAKEMALRMSQDMPCCFLGGKGGAEEVSEGWGRGERTPRRKDGIDG